MRPYIGIGVFIFNEGKFLMSKRKNAHGEGTWALMGGHLELHETFEECAKREVLEETGLTIDHIIQGPTSNDIFEQLNKHYVTIFMLSEYKSGVCENKEPEKCEELRWVEWGDTPNPLFLPVANLKKRDFDPLNYYNQVRSQKLYNLPNKRL